MKQIAFFFILSAQISCIPLSIGSKELTADFSPPRFLEASVPDESSVRLKFDRKCTVYDNKVAFGNGLTVKEITYPDPGSVFIQTTEKQEAGKEYVIDITVADSNGNTTTLLWAFYGYNSRIPSIQLNEICVNGSSTRPDMVELRCLSEGNLAGLCLYHGSPGDFKSMYIFPNVDVSPEELIIVHFKPEGIPEEIQETQAVDVSGGKQAHPNARDFWVEGGTGLSGTNGAVTLYDTPGGRLLDAFLYSNRTSSSDTTYNGFGTASFLVNVTEVTEAGGWNWPTGVPRPEDCFNPEKSTSTRTINRRENSPSGSKSSWFIGATGTASFGESNTDKEYF